jgi:FkbM family methyltransferase
MNLLKNLKEINFFIYKNKKLKKYNKIHFYIFTILIKMFGIITNQINFRLYYRLSKLISFFISDDVICKIKILKDTNFIFYLNDSYYNQLIFKGYRHDVEIENLLNKIKDIKYMFFDVGANYGYFSSIASSKIYGSKKTIAVEPVKKNYSMCRINCKSNNSRFKIINKGVGEKESKKIIYVDSKSRAGVASSLSKPNDIETDKELIHITPMNKILNKYKTNKNFVIKLDIEGEEINCLKNINNNLKNRLLIIYEDHGKDNRNIPTKYLLKKGYKVFIGLDKKIIQIKKNNDLIKLKKRKTVGYNLFATKAKEFMPHLNNG